MLCMPRLKLLADGALAALGLGWDGANNLASSRLEFFGPLMRVEKAPYSTECPHKYRDVE